MTMRYLCLILWKDVFSNMPFNGIVYDFFYFLPSDTAPSSLQVLALASLDAGEMFIDFLPVFLRE